MSRGQQSCAVKGQIINIVGFWGSDGLCCDHSLVPLWGQKHRKRGAMNGSGRVPIVSRRGARLVS